MPTAHTRHKRLSRKELRQPDEFQTFFGGARNLLDRHLKRIAVSAAIVLAVGALALGLWAYQRHRGRIAGDRFYAALSELNQKHYIKAEAAFETLARDESGRENGKLARFYLGICYLEEGKLAKARDALTAYLGSARDASFRSLALADLAVVCERMGDLKAADEAYAQAARFSGPEQAYAEIGIARIGALRGDRGGAIKAYRRFLDAHPFSVERPMVIEALAQLGASPSRAAGERGAKN